jgi:hypothetical protein
VAELVEQARRHHLVQKVELAAMLIFKVLE